MRRHVQLTDLEEDYSSAWLPSLIIFVVVFIISSIGLWKIFTKTGKAGWPALIPIYDSIVLLKIIGKPCWWTLLYFIPILNLIIHAIVMCYLADCFEKSSAFKIGLIFLPVIFLVILGFDDSKYIPPIDEVTYLTKY